MKFIYAIKDCRDEKEQSWVTEPIILDNDTQAKMAFANYQQQIKSQKLTPILVEGLRLYKIGIYDFENKNAPLQPDEPTEISVNLYVNEEEQ